MVDPNKSNQNEKQEGDEAVNFRISRIKTVTKGSKIAEFIFEKPGVNGCNIFGEEIAHPLPILPQVHIVGEGAKAGDHQDFFATIDGLAIIDVTTMTIEVTKTYLVEGDVSLATGDIAFEGSVHVTGGLRDNASITATKDVTIEKGIANGIVNCKGNLNVGLGIVKSTINCKQELTAGFIENSTLFVGGVLRSSKALVNCQIVAESIDVSGDPGLIGGGSIFCQSKLHTINLGFEADHPTIVTMGVDWNTARAISINENRKINFSHELEETEKSLTLFLKKSRAQTTQAQEDMKTGFSLRIKRLKTIIKKLEQRLKNLKVANSDCNQKSIIRVADYLRANVRILMGTKKVMSLSDCRSVYVSFQPKRGSNIFAIPEEETAPHEEAS